MYVSVREKQKTRHKGGGIVRDHFFRSGERDDLEKALEGRVGSKRNAGMSERVKNETMGEKRIFFRQKGGGMKKGTGMLRIDMSFFPSDATCVQKIALLILFFILLFPLHSFATFNPVVG